MRNALSRFKVIACASFFLLTTSVNTLADTTEVGTSGTGGTVPVEVTADAAIFSVVLPTSLSLHVDSSGRVTTASRAYIENRGSGPIKVTNVSATGVNGWKVADEHKWFDYHTITGLKEVALKILGRGTKGVGADLHLYNSLEWPAIAKENALNIKYSATVSPLPNAVTEQVANVVFTIGWGQVEQTQARSGFISKAALREHLLSGVKYKTVEVASTAFEPSLAPEGSTVLDLSEGRDGSVMAISIPSETLTIYGPSGRVYAPEDCSGMFEGLPKCAYKLSGLDVSNVTSMSRMFAHSRDGLANMTLTLGRGWNTSKVTDMSGMFDMSSMKEITSLRLLNTSNVTNMRNMFCGVQLSGIDLSGWDTSKVVDTAGMFGGINLEGRTLDLSALDFSNVQDAARMFERCNISTLKMPSAGMPSLKYCGNMFEGYWGGDLDLSWLDLSGTEARNPGALTCIMVDRSRFYRVTVASEADKNVLINGVQGELGGAKAGYKIVVAGA